MQPVPPATPPSKPSAPSRPAGNAAFASQPNAVGTEPAAGHAAAATGHGAVMDSKPPRKLREILVAARGESPQSQEPIELITMEELERRYIARVMEVVRWNKSEAAKVLGFDRSTLYRKLERYGLVHRKQAD